MHKIKNLINFYSKPLILILVINLFYFVCFGTYFEEYEGIFSSFLQGTYSKPCTEILNASSHFVILYVYELLINKYPDYQIYGFVLFTYNWLSLTLLGLVLIRIIKINISYKNTYLIILLYSILCLDNLVNLNSTRNAFIFIAALFCFIESRRKENKPIMFYQWFFIFLYTSFICLIRFEAVLLASFIYVLVQIYYKINVKISILTFLFSLTFFVSFNILVSHYLSEAKQVAIYEEKEMFDRDNINYKILSEIQLMEVTALVKYGITDKEHYSFRFFNKIVKSSSGKGFENVLNSIKFSSFSSTLKNSIKYFYAAKLYIFFYLMSCFFILIKIEPNIKNILYYLFLAVFPIFICFNSVVPLRFLVPYYSIFGCLNILQYVKRNESVKLVLLFCSVLLFYIFFDEIQIKNKYLKMDSKYNETIYKLIYYSAKSENNKPIIINLLDSDKFIPVKPLAKLPRMNSMFLNIFLFNANDFYINGWNEICKCNALSLKEKIDFIVVNQNLFLIDDKSFLFLKKYFKVKYNTELNKIDLENFDEELKLCKLNY